MATYSTRMGLTKPAGGEPRSVTPLNANVDLLDKFMPCILVNDGVTPPTGDLYDGALVKERNSGIIWEARKNGGGTYDKVYVIYPFNFVGYTTAAAQPSGTAFSLWGVTTWAQGKNSSQSNIEVGFNNFLIPIKGIYHVNWRHRWGLNGTGFRAGRLQLNGTSLNEDTEVSLPGNASSYIGIHLTFDRVLNAGDKLNSEKWQNSGGNLDLYAMLQVTLIQPIQ